MLGIVHIVVYGKAMVGTYGGHARVRKEKSGTVKSNGARWKSVTRNDSAPRPSTVLGGAARAECEEEKANFLLCLT